LEGLTARDDLFRESLGNDAENVAVFGLVG
jgi:hypothetical protein